MQGESPASPEGPQEEALLAPLSKFSRPVPLATKLGPPSPVPAAAITPTLWALFGPIHVVSSSAFAILDLGGGGAPSSTPLRTRCISNLSHYSFMQINAMECLFGGGGEYLPVCPPNLQLFFRAALAQGLGERVAGDRVTYGGARRKRVSLWVEEVEEKRGDGHWVERKPRVRGWRTVSGEGKEGDDGD